MPGDKSNYPIMVEKDGLENKKAFDLYYNIVGALKDIGLSEDDASAAAIFTYSPMAEILRKRDW